MTKKRVILIILGVLIIGALIGLIFFVRSMDDKPEDPTVDEDISIDHDTEKHILFSCQVIDIDYLQISNEFGDYQIKRNSDNVIYIVGHEKALLLPYSSAGLYESVKQVSCKLKIANGAEDLAQFGLEEPKATITVQLKNGEKTVFHIGDNAPQNDGYYLSMSGSNDVYLVDYYYGSRYLNELTYLYSKTISNVFDYSEFQSISIDYPDREDIFIRRTNTEESAMIRYFSGYVMTEPFYFSADSEIISSLTDLFSELSAEKIVTDQLTDENLEKYGFKDPIKIEIKANCNTTSYQLSNGMQNPYYGLTPDGSPYPLTVNYKIGATLGNETYVMFNDSGVIYSVSNTTMALVSSPLYQFCAKLLSIDYITALSGLTIEYEDKSYYFSIKDADAGDDMEVICDYVRLDPSLFRDFYSTLIGTALNGIGEDPGTDPVVTIKYHKIDGNDEVLEFLPYPETRRLFVKVNGEGHFTCFITKTEKIINDLNSLLKGEAIIG